MNLAAFKFGKVVVEIAIIVNDHRRIVNIFFIINKKNKNLTNKKHLAVVLFIRPEYS